MQQNLHHIWQRLSTEPHLASIYQHGHIPERTSQEQILEIPNLTLYQ